MKSFSTLLVTGCMAMGLTAWAYAKPTPTPAATATPAAATDSGANPSPEDAQKAALLNQKLDGLFKAHKYQEILKICDQIIALIPKDPAGYYAKASALNRLNKKKEALDILDTCVKVGFSDWKMMGQDEDLASLHDDARFKDLLAKAKENDQKSDQGVYEKGEEIAGVKTVEGKVAGGLRYRLRMSPDATAEKPNRLIVWLHPSGGSMDNVVERMAPEFNKRGYALLVFPQKDYAHWTEEDMNKAAVTMMNIRDVPGIDIKKPILFGYSAGGQAALMMWPQLADKLGGMVLDAAYPIAGQPEGNKFSIIAPKSAELAKAVPFFVLVGEQDGGSIMWKAAEKAWIPMGVPLTVHYIPNQKHGWLFDQEQTEALMKWLEKPMAAASQPAKE